MSFNATRSCPNLLTSALKLYQANLYLAGEKCVGRCQNQCKIIKNILINLTGAPFLRLLVPDSAQHNNRQTSIRQDTILLVA